MTAYAASPYNVSPYPASSYNALQILCYDARYASHRPELGDCAAIIGHSIAKPPIAARVRTFARRPARYQLPLPHTWRTEKGECNITIDMPPFPGETGREAAKASMLEIKRAAFEVLMKCVVGADHLGGLMQTGSNMDLQVRVEAGDGTA
ncbi:MAG: hypothetical protein Q9210_001413 [Variospora velana]